MNSLRMNNTKLKRTLLRCKQKWGTENISRCSPFPLELVFPFHHREVPIFYINIVKYFNITSIFITTKNVGFFFFCLIIPYQSNSSVQWRKKPKRFDTAAYLLPFLQPLQLCSIFSLPFLLSYLVFPSLPSQNRGKICFLPSRSLDPSRASRKLNCR